MKVSNLGKLYNSSSSIHGGRCTVWFHRLRSSYRYTLVLCGALALSWILLHLRVPLFSAKKRKIFNLEHRFQYQLEQRWFQRPPRPVPLAHINGTMSCAQVASLVSSGTWSDPNAGVVYARTLTSWPVFTVAVHTKQYDHVRWNSIYRKGAYYETQVHQRFVQILMEDTFRFSDDNNKAQVVIDVGMNIGYYTLLSAALGVDRVVALEINPKNLLRACESLRLNAYQDQVTILRRGVSDRNDERLSFHVPLSNPGEAALITKDETKKMKGQKQENVDAKDPSVVTTITLDTLAQENGWLSATPTNITIPILKIDVEGLEPQVLLGATQLLHSGLVRNVLTEFRHLHAAAAQAALTLLLDAGYRLVTPAGIVLRTRSASQAYLHQLTQHPLRDTSRSTWQKVRSIWQASFITDLWFTLPEHSEEGADF